jgi:hypothetical protein
MFTSRRDASRRVVVLLKRSQSSSETNNDADVDIRRVHSAARTETDGFGGGESHSHTGAPAPRQVLTTEKQGAEGWDWKGAVGDVTDYHNRPAPWFRIELLQSPEIWLSFNSDCSHRGAFATLAYPTHPLHCCTRRLLGKARQSLHLTSYLNHRPYRQIDQKVLLIGSAASYRAASRMTDTALRSDVGGQTNTPCAETLVSRANNTSLMSSQ